MVTPQLFVKVVSSGEQLLVKGINEAFDGVADVDGSGTFETIQAADDALDGGAYALWVKTGTYTAGFTVSTDNAYIFVEPGTVIQGAITLSGDGVTLVLGAQCDVQGVITLSGANCSLICHNGVDTDGLILSGNSGFHDGGGWDTLHNGGTANHAVEISGTDCIVKNCAAQTSAGSGNAYHGIFATGARLQTINAKVIDSDDVGIYYEAVADGSIRDSLVLGADAQGIGVNGLRTKVIGNYVIAAGGDGIALLGTGDDSIIVGNIVKDHGAQGIDVASANENCVVVGNRVDDLGTGNGVADNSGTSTVTGNDETAF